MYGVPVIALRSIFLQNTDRTFKIKLILEYKTCLRTCVPNIELVAEKFTELWPVKVSKKWVLLISFT